MSLISSEFGFTPTAADVAEGLDLSGKRAIVTGAASGIAIETARTLAAGGAEVTLAVRNLEAGERTAETISAETGNRSVRAMVLDAVDLDGNGWNSGVAYYAIDGDNASRLWDLALTYIA